MKLSAEAPDRQWGRAATPAACRHARWRRAWRGVSAHIGVSRHGADLPLCAIRRRSKGQLDRLGRAHERSGDRLGRLQTRGDRGGQRLTVLVDERARAARPGVRVRTAAGDEKRRDAPVARQSRPARRRRSRHGTRLPWRAASCCGRHSQRRWRAAIRRRRRAGSARRDRPARWASHCVRRLAANDAVEASTWSVAGASALQAETITSTICGSRVSV